MALHELDVLGSGGEGELLLTAGGFARLLLGVGLVVPRHLRLVLDLDLVLGGATGASGMFSFSIIL